MKRKQSIYDMGRIMTCHYRALCYNDMGIVWETRPLVARISMEMNSQLNLDWSMNDNHDDIKSRANLVRKINREDHPRTHNYSVFTGRKEELFKIIPEFDNYWALKG